jgi:hypothetical protein
VAPTSANLSPSTIRFESRAEDAGVRFRWPNLPHPLSILDAFGCGCAFLDYDGDGWQDVLLVAEPHPRLYRSVRGRRFEDVTAASGLQRLKGAWKGCAVGDYDGDGRPDLLLTGYHCLALLRNGGGGKWVDATAASGLQGGDRWSSGAGFMDLDGNGTLDLVLLNYVRFGPDSRRYCEPKPGIKAGCPPRYYLPEYPEVWRNTGRGVFENVSEPAGMGRATGTAQVLAFADVDGDGDPDFYIGNDGVPSDLMINEGRLRFRNAGIENGVAYGPGGGAVAAMAADFADFDHDGVFDLFVTAFSGESFPLLRGTRGGNFEHAEEAQGLAAPTHNALGFGARWVDVDNDGWPDLAVANGHVYERTAEIYAGTRFLEPLMLFHNQQGRAFHDVTPEVGGAAATPILGRGLATGDYDNDGRMDLLVVDYAGGPLLLHNTTPPGAHWITLDLRSGSPNRFAYGARVEARSGDQAWIAQVSPCASYLSSSDPRVHLGLGAASRIDSLVISWPSGKTQTVRNLAPDRVLRITEGEVPGQPAPGSTGSSPR